MNFETKAAESKKRTNLMTSVTIDWQFAQQLLPSLLNELNQDTPEFKKHCDALYTFCTNIEDAIKQLKAMIPNVAVKDTPTAGEFADGELRLVSN